MDSWRQFADNFVKVYEPLAEQFVKGMGDTNPNGFPEPFFPVAGRNYPSVPHKIVFVGMETRGWGDMENFLHAARISMADALVREQDEFDSFDFTGWSNNFGKDFWSFVLKFLANFHGVGDWKQLKRMERPEILSSFAWANLNAVERYHVTAQKRGVKYEDWQTVKRASAVVDGGDNLLRALSPHLVVIVNWGGDEKWLTEHRAVAERTEVGDHLLYFRLDPCGTHVIWTAHPTWLKFHDFDACVERCVSLAKVKLGCNRQR